MKSLVLFFRKPVPHFFSIEKIFSAVAEQLDEKLVIKKSFLPYHTSSVTKIIKNLLFARRQKGDVFHVTGDVHYVILALPKQRALLTIHDCVFLHQYTGLKRWFFERLFLKWPVEHSRLITTISEKSKEEIIKYSGCAPEKIRVINNPVNTAIYSREKPFNGSKPTLLFLGSTPNKNLSRTIEAIRGIPCRLHVVGIIPEPEEKKLVEYGIEYVKSIGLSELQLAEAYAEADMLMFPTLYEGFGLPILEAQRAGRPILTSNLSPMKEVAGGAACLVDPQSAESIRSGLLRIIEDEEYRTKLVGKGFQNVQHFEPAAIALQYFKIYEDMANNLE